MKVQRKLLARFGAYLILTLSVMALAPLQATAAPYAAMVMDARTGEILHSRNADTRLHPASLTKMMTLYIAFEAIESGEISPDKIIRISRNAAAEPPSKLGLRSGQKIAFRYLIRAAAVKSANDAATAIGEALEGSEAAFSRRMTRTAKALGMTRTTFKNAHGLTESGHMSTAHDMTILGRHMLYDYPDYYHLFSRKTVNAGMRSVNNTNRRLLGAYRGADGIKTGYTRAAGFNLVSSAERGNERIIATVFGGTSTAARNRRIAELLDMGFKRAPSKAALRKPALPNYAKFKDGGSGVVTTSLRPKLRPQTLVASVQDTAPASVISSGDIASALAEAQSDAPINQVVSVPRPEPRPADIVLASVNSQEPKQQTVSRVSTSGGRQWGVNVGRYPSRYKAERVLLTTALTEMATLDGTLRKVVRRPTGFDANFLGMTRDAADMACRRLAARNIRCETVGPS